MELHGRMWLVLFGTFMSPCKCRLLDGYEFPVYSTELCPRNQSEWDKRSSAINCTDNNGYMCIPNDDRTQLLEFCYIYPRILITKETCLYMYSSLSRVNAYNCRNFRSGCPSSVYHSSEIFKNPSCVMIGNGCFRAEQFCTSIDTTTQLQDTTKSIHVEIVSRIDIRTSSAEENVNKTVKKNGPDNNDEVTMIPILYGVLISVFFFCIACIIYRKGIQLRKRRDDEEQHIETALELSPLIQTDKHDNAVLIEQVNEEEKKKKETLAVQGNKEEEKEDEEKGEEQEHSIYIKNNQRDKAGTIAKCLIVASQTIVFCKQTFLIPRFSDNISLILPFF